MRTHVSHSLEDTARIAHEWLEHVAVIPEFNEALVLGLSGHLGSGKTSFTKALAQHLGVVEEITSPTFVIMKIYPTTHSRWKQLVHIDAYRLESATDISAINFEKQVSDPTNLIVIEWPETVKAVLGGLKEYHQLSFSIDDGATVSGDQKNTRIIVEQ